MNPPRPMKAIHPKSVKSSTPSKDDEDNNSTMASLDLSKISNASFKPGSVRPGSNRKPLSSAKPGSGAKSGSGAKPAGGLLPRALHTTQSAACSSRDDCDEDVYNFAYNEYLLQVASQYLAQKEQNQVKEDINKQLTTMATQLEINRSEICKLEKEVEEKKYKLLATKLQDECKTKTEKLAECLEPATIALEDLATAFESKVNRLNVRNLHIADTKPQIVALNTTLKETARACESACPSFEGHENVAAIARCMENIEMKLGPVEDSQTGVANCLTTLSRTTLQESALKLTCQKID